MTAEEIKIITSTIDLRETIVESIMIKYEDIFKLTYNDIFDDQLLQRIAKRNYSRIPIFDELQNCVGILSSKQLVNYEAIVGKKIKHANLKMTTPVIISQSTNLLESLSIMEQKKISILLVSNSPKNNLESQRINSRSRNDMIIENPKARITGLVCLKDIFERVVEKDFEDQDLHFKSIMSMTFGGRQTQANAIPEKGDAQLIEMVEQTEHRHLKQPLIKK